MNTYFENLIIGLLDLYILNMYVKFQSIGCYLLFNPKTYFLCIILDYKNLEFKHLINDIAIDLFFFFFGNFVSINDIRKKCNSMVDLSKFTFNKKILSKYVA